MRAGHYDSFTTDLPGADMSNSVTRGEARSPGPNYLSIVAQDDERPDVEKAPESFDIDLLRCVYCGFCVEACPCDAIRMDTGIFEIAADNRDAFRVDLDFLLNNTTDGVKR